MYEKRRKWHETSQLDDEHDIHPLCYCHLYLLPLLAHYSDLLLRLILPLIK